MSAPKDCSPAFPIVTDDDQKEHLTVEWGLTKREWFAGMALQGLASGISYDDVSMCSHAIAKSAYELADSMLRLSDE